MHISELETPAVVIDLDVMDQNLSRMADYCRRHQLLLDAGRCGDDPANRSYQKIGPVGLIGPISC